MRAPGDLADAATRARVTAALARGYAGRPVLLGPGTLSAWSPWVARFRDRGSQVLVVSTGPGSGPVVEPDVLVEIRPPPVLRVTDELRHHDRLVRTLPASARAMIDAFDPAGEGVWLCGPFVTSDAPIDGRPVTGGRPSSYLALEDKARAEAVWSAAGLTQAPYRWVPVEDPAGLAAATAELGGARGVVWSGDGVSGAGDYVRWVRHREDQVRARAFFALHCSRVRVAPFLAGVPCSIHGLVLPDGTAALRPVRLLVEPDPDTGRLVGRGLSSRWDPPPDDRESMRAAVRRVGTHLARAHDYRGAFGIDGVLTPDGFRPTDLNPRMTAGLTLLGRADPALFLLLHTALLVGDATGLTVAEVETVVPLLDAERHEQHH